MQYDNIYEIKENKKDNNLKTQNLIISTQSKVPNNTKIHQPKVEIKEKYILKKKVCKKWRKKMSARKGERNNLLCVEREREREWEREREREREI